MASFPGAKVHRVSRRKLGRGQHSAVPGVAVVITGSSAANTITLTFGVPVIVNGTIPTVVNNGTSGLFAPTAQSVLTPTTVAQTMGGTMSATSVVTVPGGASQVVGVNGGFITAATATI